MVRPPWMTSPPHQISWKYIHRSFIPKASIAFRSFLPYSKQLALVSMLMSLPLFQFCPTVNYMPWLTIVTSAKYCMWCNHSNPTMQTIQNHCWVRLKIVHSTHKLNFNNFKMVEAMGLKNTASWSPSMASPPYQISWKSTNRFNNW
jgi:hypothetical protein